MASRFSQFMQILFFACIVFPVVLVVLGLRIVGKDNLPHKGPAILIANHNSHLDTLVLMCLFGLKGLHRVRPVAAADYFITNKFMAWFSQNIIGIVPIARKITAEQNPLEPVYKALDQNQIVIFYPEGSRGEPEKLAPFKKGIAHIIEKYPSVPIYPVYMQGLGKSLPKGDPLLVPFFCDIHIGAVYAPGGGFGAGEDAGDAGAGENAGDAASGGDAGSGLGSAAGAGENVFADTGIAALDKNALIDDLEQRVQALRQECQNNK